MGWGEDLRGGKHGAGCTCPGWLSLARIHIPYSTAPPFCESLVSLMSSKLGSFWSMPSCRYSTLLWGIPLDLIRSVASFPDSLGHPVDRQEPDVPAGGLVVAGPRKGAAWGRGGNAHGLSVDRRPCPRASKKMESTGRGRDKASLGQTGRDLIDRNTAGMEHICTLRQVKRSGGGGGRNQNELSRGGGGTFG